MIFICLVLLLAFTGGCSDASDYYGDDEGKVQESETPKKFRALMKKVYFLLFCTYRIENLFTLRNSPLRIIFENSIVNGQILKISIRNALCPLFFTTTV